MIATPAPAAPAPASLPVASARRHAAALAAALRAMAEDTADVELAARLGTAERAVLGFVGRTIDEYERRQR